MTKMLLVTIDTSGVEGDKAVEWLNELLNVYADIEIEDTSVSGNRISFRAGFSGMDDTEPEDIKSRIEEYLTLNEAFQVKDISVNGQDTRPPLGIEDLKLSPSVRRAIGNLPDKVRAFLIIKNIVFIHPEYAKNQAEARISDADISQSEKSVAEWLNDVRSLYDQKAVPELHGRLVILGLSFLDYELGNVLHTNRFLQGLEEEIDTPLDPLLTERGRELRRTLSLRRDAVPTHTDYPATVDELGREVFAESLAKRLDRVRADNEKSGYSGAFLMHIHGPWGSGKTTLLNLLRKKLESESTSGPKSKNSQWIVIDFNAWQHQRIGPPWWSLMDAVFKQSVQKLKVRKMMFWRSVKLSIWERIWRLWTGRSHVFIWVALFFGVLGLAMLFGVFDTTAMINATHSGNQFLAFLDNKVSAVIALVVSLLTGIRALGSSLLPGSARAAHEFVQLSSDPTKRLSCHFAKLVNMIGQPLVIFIDDLDRCQGSYTVELLEGIQTIFKKANVAYVIAADRRWIYTGYDKAYDAFTSAIDEPGRPMGYLFLDKVFQLSVSLPRLSTVIKQQYWDKLLEELRTKGHESLDQARRDANQKFQNLHTEDEIIAELNKGASNPISDQARREAAVMRLAAPEVEAHTVEHLLRDFMPLLEPNPRAMKRLVNAYGAARDIDVLEGILGGRRQASVEQTHIERKKLALWTIVNLRWPRLAEYLEDHPEMVDYILYEMRLEGVGITENLRKLFTEISVRNVIQGKDIGAALDERSIRHLIGLGTSESNKGPVA
jgi:hypothetical protein